MIGVKQVEKMQARAEQGWKDLTDGMKSELDDSWDRHKMEKWLSDAKPFYMMGFTSGWRDGIDTIGTYLKAKTVN